MKQILICGCCLFLFFASTSAQENSVNAAKAVDPKWISNEGYWVIESNIKTPKNSIVYFYDNSNVLIYKEQVDGVVININKRKIKMSLKKVLEQAVYVYDQKKFHSENEMWVMNAVK